MECELREWRMEDKEALAALLNNKKILDNLRDGIPYPYEVKDAEEFLSAMLAADKDRVFAFAITAGGALIGSISAERCQNIHSQTAELGYYLESRTGERDTAPAPSGSSAAMFLKTPISCGFLQNPLPAIRRPAGCLKKPASGWRGH